MGINWVNEVDNLKRMIEQEEKTLEEIGKIYDVSRQRLYQVLTKFGIETGTRKRKNFLRDKEPKYYWLNKMLAVKKVKKEQRIHLLETMSLPDYCPVFKVKLNYEGTGEGPGWTKKDNSPSIDQIVPGAGYTADNMQIICWRANRIKNDATPEELEKLAVFMKNLGNNTQE